MTAYRTRPLSRADQAELLQLSAACDTGSSAFRVDRGPDFFAFGDMLGETRYQGVTCEGALVGCVAMTLQRRFLAGEGQTVAYLHDLRVHPAHRVGRVAARLLHDAFDAQRASLAWAFATVLDSNPHQDALVRIATRLFGRSRLLGRTAHLGLPLLRLDRRQTRLRVEELSGADWEAHYLNLAARCDLASAEPSHWRRLNGRYLGAFRGAELCALSKAVSGEETRRVIVADKAAFGTRCERTLLSLLLRAPLPKVGQRLAHGYLAFQVGERNAETLTAFSAHVRDHLQTPWCWVFTGDAATAGPATPRLGVRLTSSTYAFGDVPAHLQLAAHELTLI
jgi:hypothetical protein